MWTLILSVQHIEKEDKTNETYAVNLGSNWEQHRAKMIHEICFYYFKNNK